MSEAPDCACFDDLSLGRLNECHVGVRFRDGGPGWSVLLNGEDVTIRCWEAYGGPDGWAILYTPKTPDGCWVLCRNQRHAERSRLFGRVQVIRGPSQ
jgi:hypothetical protein